MTVRQDTAIRLRAHRLRIPPSAAHIRPTSLHDVRVVGGTVAEIEVATCVRRPSVKTDAGLTEALIVPDVAVA